MALNSYSPHTWETGEVVTAAKLNNIEQGVNNAQEKLSTGANVQITNNVISATDTTYTAGTNVTIDADNKINAANPKTWLHVSLDEAEMTEIQNGNNVTVTLAETFNPDDFSKTYVHTTIEASSAEKGKALLAEDAFTKLYVNTAFGSYNDSWLYNYMVEMFNKGSVILKGAERYKTVVFGIGADEGVKELQANILTSKNLVHIQDVSQQDWEYDGSKEETKSGLESTTVGAAYVMCIHGATETITYLVCFDEGRGAAYWDSTDECIKWARLDAGEFYQVTYDDATTGHGTLRWLVTPQTIEEEVWATPLTDEVKAHLVNDGIAFEADKYAAYVVVDDTHGVEAEAQGLDKSDLDCLFSWNQAFAATGQLDLHLVSRPTFFGTQIMRYTDPETQEVQVEEDGEYVFVADFDGDPIDAAIPCNDLTKLVINGIQTSEQTIYNSLLRHTFTIRTGNTVELIPDNKFYVNGSFMAVNTQYGNSDLSYILHSDESENYSGYDWVLPFNGQVGMVITGEEGKQIQKWYHATKILAGWTNSGTEEEPVWVRTLFFEVFDEDACSYNQIAAITDATITDCNYYADDYVSTICEVISPYYG